MFGDKEIYNPWSTLKYIDRKLQNLKLKAISFWTNTSSNDIIYDYIKKGNNLLHEEFETLMQGKSIVKTIKPELTYRDMNKLSNIYSYTVTVKRPNIQKGRKATDFGKGFYTTTNFEQMCIRDRMVSRLSTHRKKHLQFLLKK